MQVALEAFASQANPRNDKLIILLVDRAGWHTSQKLEIPKNIIMYPIPAYTQAPESDGVYLAIIKGIISQ